MLGKLLKYEFRSQVKLYCGSYAFAVLIAIISFVFHILYDNNKDVVFFEVAQTFSVGILVFAIVVIFAGTLIFSILRYRSNLLRDEGYLMHTLPVKTYELVLSKLIVAVCWFCADAVVAYVLISFALQDFSGIGSFVNAMAQAGYTNKALVVVFCIICFLMGTVASLAQFYVSLSIGYSSYGNKDVMSFVAYIVIYFGLQIVSLIVMGLMFIGCYKTLSPQLNSMDERTGVYFEVMIMLGSFLFSFLISIVELVVATKMMEKKLNLE